MAGTQHDLTPRRRSLAGRALSRVVDVRSDETAAMLWSCTYFFCLLSSYYIVRPLRETMGVEGGVRNLKFLYVGTFVAITACNPLFWALVSKLPRRRFIPIVYHFFALNMLAFYVLLEFLPSDLAVQVGRVFYVWTSVFNLFVISVFWQFMADLYRSDQGKRLFGFIAAGGSVGAIAGSGLTSLVAERMGAPNLLLVSVALLEAAVLCVWMLFRLRGVGESAHGAPLAQREPRGGLLDGLTLLATSPYLLVICVYLFLRTLTSTFLYFEQAEIVSGAEPDSDARTAIFANIDLAVNVLTLVCQVFVTGRLMRWLGVGITLAVLPLIAGLGFLGLAASTTLGVFVVFQVLYRSTNYAVSRPSREVLFTVVTPEEKYKSKSFIDTAVYRGGDVASAWLFELLRTAAGLGLGGVALLAAPVSLVWVVTALWLGRRQERMAAAESPGAV